MTQIFEIATLYKAAKWTVQTVEMWRYAHKNKHDIEVLKDNLESVQNDTTNLFQYFLDTKQKHVNELDAALRTLVNLDTKLSEPPKKYKHSDVGEILAQYINQFKAISFLNEHSPVLSQSITSLKSNTVNSSDYEVNSLLDYIGFLEGTTDNLRLGNEKDLDEKIREFELNHVDSAVYHNLRALKLTTAKTATGRIKRLNNKKAKKNFFCYVSNVITSLKDVVPEYHPLGKFVPRNKINIQSKSDGIHINLYHRFFPIELDCRYESQIIEEWDIQKAEKKAKKTGKKTDSDYLHIDCRVSEFATKDVKEQIQNFDSYEYTPILFELDTNELYFNENSRSASTFSGYFDPKVKPDSMHDLLKTVVNKRRIVSRDLQQKLGFSGDRIQNLVDGKLVRKLYAQGGVYALIRGE